MDSIIQNNQKTHKYTQSFNRGSIKVIDCLTCGYKHLWPIPHISEIEEFYKNKYFKSVQEDYVEKQSDDKEFLNFTYQDKLDIFNKLLDSNSEKKLLDIGCGSGKFLQFCYEKGWDCVGIEPNESLNRSTDYPIYCEFIEKIDHSKIGKFNVVVLSGVLEHISNPREICKLVYDKFLLKNGIICVEVPNEFNELQMIINEYIGEDKWWISYPDHINYFEKDSLNRLLESIGFNIELNIGSFPLELFVLFGENYLKNDDVGRAVHLKRVEFERALVKTNRANLKKILYQKFAEIGLGRTIITYARKK